MKLSSTYKICTLVLLLFIGIKSHAQLGFCSGNSGDPIFTEDFGVAPSAALQNIPLPSGTTTYDYLGTTIFADGRYTVSNSSDYWNWFDGPNYNFEDHTPNDANGRMLIVNASHTPGEFFSLPVTGLCENTTYEFSAWLVNLTPRDLFHNGSLPNPCNVSFEIWDSLDTTQLASGTTGDFLGGLSTENAEWVQSGLVFQTLPGQTSVILKMVNNGVGGYGNDLAIDDIVFKSCGDFVSVSDGVSNASITVCSSQTPYATNLIVTPDFSVFSSHFYQWQESTDGIIWTDIAGETNANISITGITTTTFYRSKVAESMVNLNNSSCNTVSDMFQVNIEPAPTMPTIECWETATFDDSTCSWNVSGTQPVQPTLECWESATFNSVTCTWDITGVQPTQPVIECWETATFNDTTCSWDISGTQPVQPALECWQTTNFNSVTCTWDISGTQPAQPSLECWESATFNDTTCSWDVSGTQPLQPTLECWETTNFNTVTCTWDISGTQPVQPTIECWETATFNNTTCSWDVSGTQPTQPTLECWESALFNTVTCTWDISGTQPAQPTIECWETAIFNNATCTWNVSGIQPTQPTLECWQTATFNNTTCTWDVTGTQPVDFIEEFLTFCAGNDITMYADSDLVNPTYQWNTGEITDFKTVDVAGTYVVIISDGCSTIETTFNVEQIPSPIIESVVSNGSSIIVNTSNTGDFEYSIDGIVFQSSPVFSGLDGGYYTIYVKGRDCDSIVTFDHFHFYIQKFITPNDDGDNDYFVLRGIEFFGSSEVSIYNRYGKILYQSINAPAVWDGTFNNEPLPTNDYWYVIVIEGKRYTGHFTLKR